MKKKPAALYRKLLRDAWKLTNGRKKLWVFAFFAFLASSGGIMEITFRSFRRIEHGRVLFSSVLSGSVPGFDVAGQYVRQLGFLETERVVATLTILTIAAVAVGVFSVVSQGALIHGISARKEPHWVESLRAGTGHFWSLLWLDLLAKTANFLLVILTTVPLIAFAVTGNLFEAALYFLLFAVFFPLIIVVAIVAMIASIDIVKHGRHTLSAIEHAMRLFARHWVITLELGIILFFIVIIAGLAAFAALLLLAIPYSLLLIAALYSATPFIFSLVNVLGFVVFATILLAYVGGATTFQYAAWWLFYDSALKRTAFSRLVPKIRRLLS